MTVGERCPAGKIRPQVIKFGVLFLSSSYKIVSYVFVFTIAILIPNKSNKIIFAQKRSVILEQKKKKMCYHHVPCLCIVPHLREIQILINKVFFFCKIYHAIVFFFSFGFNGKNLPRSGQKQAIYIRFYTTLIKICLSKITFCKT